MFLVVTTKEIGTEVQVSTRRVTEVRLEDHKARQRASVPAGSVVSFKVKRIA